ncbi:DUF177 domain-containing protein [Inhella sp.]|uniref:YceD family protein n=1 Tax=Inhella sp. TaxID=1921806 RepID=UPI0035AEA432
MTSKTWNPLRLDVAAFARDGGYFEGSWPAQALTRFAQGAPECPAEEWSPVQWSVTGEERVVTGGAAQWWLRLQVRAQTQQTCQRCLSPVAVPLEIDRWTQFVRDEAEAAALDAEQEEDVLVASRNFDCKEWLEDELLLALPIVPMHERCPSPVALKDAPPEAALEPPEKHPFAVLAALKRKSGTGSA